MTPTYIELEAGISRWEDGLDKSDLVFCMRQEIHGKTDTRVMCSQFFQSFYLVIGTFFRSRVQFSNDEQKTFNRALHFKRSRNQLHASQPVYRKLIKSIPYVFNLSRRCGILDLPEHDFDVFVRSDWLSQQRKEIVNSLKYCLQRLHRLLRTPDIGLTCQPDCAGKRRHGPHGTHPGSPIGCAELAPSNGVVATNAYYRYHRDDGVLVVPIPEPLFHEPPIFFGAILA